MGSLVGFVVSELTLEVFAAHQKTCSKLARPLHHASSSKASCLDGPPSPQAQASGDAKRALAKMSVEAAATATVEARGMAAAMAAANATATAATTAVAAAMATASDSCVGGICTADAAAGATTASNTAVKVEAR